MPRKKITVIVGPGLGLLLWVLQMAGIKLPIWLIVVLIVLATIMIGVGIWAFSPDVVRFTKRIRFRIPIWFANLDKQLSDNYTRKNTRAISFPPGDINNSLAINRDALEHVVIEARSHTQLVIHRGCAGWPVVYPIRLRNTRYMPVDIIGYNVTILWDGAPIHRIAWKAPNGYADNGLAVHPPFDSPQPLQALCMQPDSAYQLEIPVNVVQVANWPAVSPRWTARGTINFRCGNEPGEKQFNFDTDNYQLAPSQWDELKDHIISNKNP